MGDDDGNGNGALTASGTAATEAEATGCQQRWRRDVAPHSAAVDARLEDVDVGAGRGGQVPIMPAFDFAKHNSRM